MKLGIGFNTFSGCEFLKPVLQNCRPFADYIVLMYSPISDTGTQAPAFTEPLIESLVGEGLVDEVIECKMGTTADCVKIQDLNRARYVKGKETCLAHGCTHYMGRDTDEFYNLNEFKRAMAVIEEKDYDFTIAPLYDYIQMPSLRAKAPSKLHVPFIHKIDCEYRPKHFPVLLDLGRTVVTDNFHIFKESTVVMHHFTGVRYNETELVRKFEGHSHYTRLGQKGVEEYLHRIQNPEKGIFQIVPDQFNIATYWEKEFKTLYERYMNEK